MDYLYAEDPLPNDLCYPLKRGTLDSCLQAAGIENVHRVFFTRRQRQGRMVQADYWPLDAKGDPEAFFAAGKASISIFAVAEGQSDAAQRPFVEEVLARLCGWLRKAGDESAGWRAEPHFIAFRLEGGNLEVIEH